MKSTQYVRHLLNNLGIAVTVFLFISTQLVQGQDYKKVIEVVQKMESNLKTQIAHEQKAREAEFAKLSEQIQMLQNNAISGTAKKHHAVNQVSAAEAISLLEKGNKRYTSDSFSKKEYVKERKATANSQHPYAIVLTCADSRVAPELLFDESIGKLFVIRDAGNVVDSVILGTIEYAAEHLNVKLLLILGHESCGAVTATVAGGDVSPNISSLVWRMQFPVDKIKAIHENNENLVSMCVEENVRYQLEQSTLQSGVLSELVEKGELTIMGGVYDISSGKVKFLNSSAHDPQIEKNGSSDEH
jgi:carbonic anhydrase